MPTTTLRSLRVLRRRSVRVAALCDLWARFEPRIFLTSALFRYRTQSQRNTNYPKELFSLINQRGVAMDWNRVEGNWKEMKGKVKEKWGKLTDDDLTAINGQREQLEGRLQERYGYAEDQTQKEVDSWFSSLK
jgi:uncharacterized protein YjbJ (UPF0337 family)